MCTYLHPTATIHMHTHNVRMHSIQMYILYYHIRTHLLQIIDTHTSTACTHFHCVEKCIEGYVADVPVVADEESTEDVDPQDPQATLGVDSHDGPHGLVEHSVGGILATFRVGGHLSKNVVELLTCIPIALS